MQVIVREVTVRLIDWFGLVWLIELFGDLDWTGEWGGTGSAGLPAVERAVMTMAVRMVERGEGVR